MEFFFVGWQVGKRVIINVCNLVNRRKSGNLIFNSLIMKRLSIKTFFGLQNEKRLTGYFFNCKAAPNLYV